MPDQAPTDPASDLDDAMRQAIEERLAASIAKHRTRRENRRRAAAEIAKRRRHGLQARHATKLNRHASQRDTAEENRP